MSRRREMLPQVVVSETELAVIRENAQAAGLTLSAWIRQSSLSTQPQPGRPAGLESARSAKPAGTPNGTPGNPPGAAPAATKRAAPNFRKI